MLRLFLGRAPRLEQARGPGAAATSPVLHPPNDTSVLRYIGPIMLRRSEVSQDRSTVGLKRRMKEVILPASPSCSCKTMYQQVGCVAQWIWRRSEVEYSGFAYVGRRYHHIHLRSEKYLLRRHSKVRGIHTSPFQTKPINKGGRVRKLSGLYSLIHRFQLKYRCFVNVNILLGANQTSLRRRIPFYLGMMKHFMRKIISRCLPGNLFQNSC